MARRIPNFLVLVVLAYPNRVRGGGCQETRTSVTFFLFLFTMDALLLLPLTTFPLRVLPNRLHSPPPLVLIVASSLT